MDTYTIGQIAEQTDVGVETIRYYWTSPGIVDTYRAWFEAS